MLIVVGYSSDLLTLCQNMRLQKAKTLDVDLQILYKFRFCFETLKLRKAIKNIFKTLKVKM